MSSAQYLLNSLGFSLGGAIASSIYWRIYFHRKLVALGAATKEPPLMAFTAVIVVAVSCMGLLFGEANRMRLDDYVECHARVDQNNVETINDRSQSAIIQLRNEIQFYEALSKVLSQPQSIDIRLQVLTKLQQQIATDQRRLEAIQSNPLQPITDCKKPQAGSS